MDAESNFLGSKWNDKSYDEEERKIIDVGCIKIARTRPFQSECIMLLGTTVLRPEEALKLKKLELEKAKKTVAFDASKLNNDLK